MRVFGEWFLRSGCMCHKTDIIHTCKNITCMLCAQESGWLMLGHQNHQHHPKMPITIKEKFCIDSSMSLLMLSNGDTAHTYTHTSGAKMSIHIRILSGRKCLSYNRFSARLAPVLCVSGEKVQFEIGPCFLCPWCNWIKSITSLGYRKFIDQWTTRTFTDQLLLTGCRL